ncbi:MAG: hypothetical protein E6929_07765 [Clostridium sp.]|nr:hypothetical protein [Clostridium sp.]
MNYKEQLKAVFNKFIHLKNNIEVTIKAINADERYASDYKNNLIETEKRNAQVQQQELSKEAVGIILNAKNELLKGKKSMEKDQAFDIKLSNTLKIIESIGQDMNVEELQELVNPFKDDYQTMKILRRIFVKGDLKGIQEIFGIDKIDHNISMLNDLEKRIVNTFSGDIMKANTMALSIALELN